MPSNNTYLLPHSSGGRSLQFCQQGRLLLEALRESVSQASWQSLVFLGLWLHHFSFHLHLHQDSSLCVCVLFPSYRGTRTSIVAFRTHPKSRISYLKILNLITHLNAKPLFQISSPPQILGVRTWTYLLGDHHWLNPIQLQYSTDCSKHFICVNSFNSYTRSLTHLPILGLFYKQRICSVERWNYFPHSPLAVLELHLNPGGPTPQFTHLTTVL